MRATRVWAKGLAIGLAAAGVLFMLTLAPRAVHAGLGGPGPKDAYTLVRQALAALEAAPPDLAVAGDKIQDALQAKDTRGVDMARVQEAAQAFALHDPVTAAARLIDALIPTTSGGSDSAEIGPLIPALPRFTGTPVEHLLLACAGVLLATGGLIVRRL